MLKWILALIGVVMLAPLRGVADVPDSRYVPARARALGSAGIPMVDDAAGALFYQPAQLGKNRKLNFEPINLQLYGNSGFFGTANRASLNALSIDAMSANLRNNPNTRVSLGGALTPTLGIPYLAFGILAQTRLLAYADSQQTIHSTSLYQLVPAVGTGVSLGHGILKLGYSLQWVNQASGSKTSALGTNAGGFNEGIGEGHAFSHTVGLAFTLPYRYLPSFHLVVRDLGGTRFSSGSIGGFAQNAVGVPAFEPMTFHGAIGWTEKLGRGSEFSWNFQARDFTNRSQTSTGIRYTTGLELSLKDAIYLRGGFGNGYPSAGIGFRAKKRSDFSFTWYSEELTGSYHGTRDQRYLLQYQMRVF